MTGNFRSRLTGGETLLGTMVTLPGPTTAEILASIGFDWLFIDGEHGPLDVREILGILQAVGDRAACIVRVPAADEPAIKKVLDMGAEGIIVPQVNTAEQAASVVRFARYAPAGARGVGLARAHGYGSRFQEYLQKANDQVAIIVQAEHALAVQNIDAIVKVPGIDAVLLGPYDLSASLGKMGQIDDPTVIRAIDRVVDVCHGARMPLGCFGLTAAAAKPYIDRGCTLIVAGVDALFLGSAARNLLTELRSAVRT
jgi:2-keto-3-deoxy-L-rhamnonate aldolase RhmA